MHYPFPADVKKLVSECMASGRFSDEDELLRAALRSIQQGEDDWAAIQEALDDMEQGDRGVPLDEAFENVRRKIDQEMRP